MSIVKRSKRSFKCPIFGSPNDLSRFVLPTYQDVLKCYLFEYKNLQELSGYYPSSSDIVELVSIKVEELYDKLLIPRVSHQRVKQLIIKYYQQYLKIKKHLDRVEKSVNGEENLKKFKDNSLKLFDIASCKCNTFDKCKCPKNKKVPLPERNFLSDQRSSRRLSIGSVDRSNTNEFKRKLERNSKDAKKLKKQCIEEFTTKNVQSSQDSNSSEDYDSQDLYKQHFSKTASSTQSRIELKNVALISQRYGISTRATAALVNAAFQDAGIASESNLVDKNKILREQKKVAIGIRSENDENNSIRGLSFDGRHDQTQINEKKGNKYFKGTALEDHYSLIQEPGSKYLSHVTPKKSDAKSIANSIILCLKEEFPTAMETLEAVGCDGTVVNTGRKGGVILRLEVEIGRPIQRFICLLHFNELPLRHLFQKIDGVTSGPNTYSGPIGKELKDCENLKVVSFEPIDCVLPEIDLKILSDDQKYLFEISKAVSSGNCSEDLANRHPGNISHSRWLTSANRILRLYISSENPSEDFKEIVNFILKVYVPSWFRIKINCSVKDGSKNLFEFIRSTRYLSEKYLKIIDPVIERNAYFAAPENILLGMLTDEDPSVRRLALEKILEAKRLQLENNNNNKFEIPKLNFEATNYINMIDWSISETRSPPVLRNLTINDIERTLNDNQIPSNWNFTAFPCHTQAVERTVKLVTEASSRVIGKENRHNWIIATLKSRSIMPEFNSKKDFKQFIS